jgi:hypothetical protein
MAQEGTRKCGTIERRIIERVRVAEPKLFFSAPAPTFKKFPLRLRLRLEL